MFKFTKRSSKKFKMIENKIQYDDISNNGLIIDDKYVPEELISLILCYIDHSTLLACQLVCKQWHFIIQKIIWYKKAELALRTGPISRNLPWPAYYYMCSKTPFDKNLIKNHSGELGIYAHWTMTSILEDGWSIECPPLGVPELPRDPVFEGKKHCFVNSHYINGRTHMDNYTCGKYQIIDLVYEGFSKYLLDYIQPKIKISEWYCGRLDCPSVYVSNFQLIGEKKGKKEKVIDNHKFIRLLNRENHNMWFKNEYEFKNYGKGLRKIKFIHSGQDERFLTGHLGTKMAGACVKVENPFTTKIANPV